MFARSCLGTGDIAEPTRKFKVFLGGACNPTTWRVGAMQKLDAANIAYFNPQIDTWTPDCMAIEKHEKKEATVLLFVFTPDTRGQATLVEAAVAVANVNVGASTGSGNKKQNQQQVILVLNTYVSAFDGGAISIDEQKDVNRGREYLRDEAMAHGVPIYHNVDEAIQAIQTVLLTILKAD